jgi:hypothetical protein
MSREIQAYINGASLAFQQAGFSKQASDEAAVEMAQQIEPTTGQRVITGVGGPIGASLFAAPYGKRWNTLGNVAAYGALGGAMGAIPGAGLGAGLAAALTKEKHLRSLHALLGALPGAGLGVLAGGEIGMQKGLEAGLNAPESRII